MNIFGLKLDLIILHITAVSISMVALEPPYSRSHYVPQAAYLPNYGEQALPDAVQFPTTTDASKVYKIEVDVPQLVRSYLGLKDGHSRSEGAPISDDSNKFKLELKTPDFTQMWDSFREILRESTDRRHEGAYVEEAPGSFKSEPVKYPKNFHENNLMKLLKLKEKMGLSRRSWGGYEDDDEQFVL